jgi:hypothetical protein
MSAQKITRRVFLGTTAFVVSAPILAKIPASESKNALQITLEPGQFFSANELTVLTDIAEIMIPKTQTPGATDAQVIPVLDALMLTWAGTDTKAGFKALIEQLNQLSADTFSSTYTKLAQGQRLNLLTELDKRAFAKRDTNLSKNYRKLKETIFHIYYTSEEANPDYLLIPGSYKGCLSKEEYTKMVDERLGRSA